MRGKSTSSTRGTNSRTNLGKAGLWSRSEHELPDRSVPNIYPRGWVFPLSLFEIFLLIQVLFAPILTLNGSMRGLICLNLSLCFSLKCFRWLIHTTWQVTVTAKCEWFLSINRWDWWKFTCNLDLKSSVSSWDSVQRNFYTAMTVTSSKRHRCADYPLYPVHIHTGVPSRGGQTYNNGPNRSFSNSAYNSSY